LIRLGLTLLILTACLLAAGTWRVYGHTWDEPEHLAAGMELLDRGKYEYDTEHPPIARALIALGPYLAGSRSFGTPPPDGTQEGVDILYDGGHYDRTLRLARLGVLPFLALLMWAMWLWGRKVVASEGQALLSVLLLASVPPVVGHAALAALDVPAAATVLLAFYLLQRWWVSGRWPDAVLFGLSAGLAFGTKLSAVPFIAVGMLALLLVRLVVRVAPAGVTRQGVPTETAWRGAQEGLIWRSTQAGASWRGVPAEVGWRGRLAGMALITIAALVPILLAYGRHALNVTTMPLRFAWVMGYLFQNGSPAFIQYVHLPGAWWDFAEGVMAVEAHNNTGHVSFLLGTVRAGGWWYFYLVALAVKTPLPLLVLGPIGLCLLARDGYREGNAWRLAPPALFLALLVFASVFSRINIGIRHVLILYPFLALGGVWTLTYLWRAWPPIGKGLAAMLVAWQVGSAVVAYPDWLPYFNETVENPAQVLVDSDLDWGQDLRRLERRLAELKVPRISLAYQGTADLSREALPPFVRLLPRQTATGWVAINALTREHEPAGYAWLGAYRPVERIGKTIDLYFIPP
jgi:Dolichyl-phosphate-mannose-protein mannosyltransferase